MADILLDDDGNAIQEIVKRKPGRPPLKPEDKVGHNQSVKRGPRFSQHKKGGRPRVSTDVNSEELGNVFKSLKKVSTNPNPFSIAELICNVVTADLKNLIPGDVVTRTQKSIEILNDISEDMIYTGGGVGVGDDLPEGLDDINVKQIESKDVTDKIINQLPEKEIQPLEIDKKGFLHGNEKGKITEEVGTI